MDPGLTQLPPLPVELRSLPLLILPEVVGRLLLHSFTAAPDERVQCYLYLTDLPNLRDAVRLYPQAPLLHCNSCDPSNGFQQ